MTTLDAGGGTSKRSFRSYVHSQLDPAAYRGRGLSVTNKTLVAVILLATIHMVLDTEPYMQATFGAAMRTSELLFGVFFAIEYALRFWSSAEDAARGGGWRGRARFAFSPSGLIDLLVVAVTFAPFAPANLMFLRLFRLLRIIRLAKLGRMTKAFEHLVAAVKSRSYELIASLSLAMSLMLAGASVMWWAEGSAQPGAFGSIPRALWWALVTLTTIGYGDAYPITPIGKICAGIFAIAGIGMIALPTGVLAAAFSEHAQEHRRHRDRQPRL